jgi:hypothetical protein
VSGDEPRIQADQPTDALARIVRTCVCGSDLYPDHQMPASGQGVPMGHVIGDGALALTTRLAGTPLMRRPCDLDAAG